MFAPGIENGVVVGPRGRDRRNARGLGGRVAVLTPERHEARVLCDPGGLPVMPGMVDVPIHLMDPAGTTRTSLPTGTSAAAGVTTIIEPTPGPQARTAADLDQRPRYRQGRSLVPSSRAAHAWPEGPDEVASPRRAGAVFVKVFTGAAHSHPGCHAAVLPNLFRRASAAGDQPSALSGRPHDRAGRGAEHLRCRLAGADLADRRRAGFPRWEGYPPNRAGARSRRGLGGGGGRRVATVAGDLRAALRRRRQVRRRAWSRNTSGEADKRRWS